MQVNKKQLQEALGIVKPALSKSEEIEQSTSFAFIEGRVITYDDEISISHPVEGIDFEGAIESDKLYQFLTKIKPGKNQTEDTLFIDLQIKDNELIITSGKATAGLTLQSEIKLPLKEELSSKGKWKQLPSEFIRFISFCIPVTSTDLSKPLYKCLHIRQDGVVESTDGHRIAYCKFPKEGTMPINSFLLPVKAARLLVELKPIYISEGKGWVHFKNEAGTTLSGRIFYGEKFPDTSPFITLTGEGIAFSNSLNSVLDRASVFSKNDKMNMIEIIVNSGILTIKVTSDLGWFKETAKCAYEGDPLQFTIDPAVLKAILSETQVGEITATKMIFRGDDWLYLTTLQPVK